MYGELQGIAGSALQEIDGLDVQLLGSRREAAGTETKAEEEAVETRSLQS